MSVYITLAEAKAHCHVDFTDDDVYIQSLCDLVEELVLTEIKGSITGEGTVTTAGTITGAGTVTTAGTVTLTGVLTTFEDYLVGDTITVSGETIRTIDSIVSDTELTVSVAFATTAGGLTYTIGSTALVGSETNFLDYDAGDTISVDGERVRTIATITDDENLTVTLPFLTTETALTYTMHPGMPIPLPLGLKQAMLLLVGHYYLIREPVMVGIGVTEIPFAYKYLISPWKNWTVT